MRTRLIIGIAALQVLVLAYMAGEREWVLRTGRIIYLRSAPTDPRDAMRGDYLRVNYDMSVVPRALCRGSLAATNKTFEAVPADTKVYALLHTNEDGVAAFEALTSERPKGGLFIRGRTERSWGESLQVRYGVEAYFMQQGKADALERESDRGALAVSLNAQEPTRSELARVPLEMEVAVSSGGLAVLKDHRRAALGIGLRLETRQEAGTNAQRLRRTVAATVRLFNASSNDLAVVDMPGGRSLALVPTARWSENPWRWVHEGEAQPAPESARVIVLRPGQSHSITIPFTEPVWSVWKEEKGKPGKRTTMTLGELTQDWSTRFRFEYRPPERAACAKLPNAALIWHGWLASRAFNPSGGVD